MAHHEPFKALGPLDWSSLDRASLPSFLDSTFASAQTLVDSIPLPAAVSQAQRVGLRARSHTEGAAAAVDVNSALTPPSAPAANPAHAAALQREWREVKINPRDNPLAINVYKLGARDGKGAWFARRSVHEGLTFAKFQLGLEREFAEALKVTGAPGAGNVRGIGAERKVEHEVVEGKGKAEVYQLSAQFPGPTTARDFVTLLLSSTGSGGGAGPRQFMVVSKPCVHPKCTQRSGFIRGQYESVEIIREIPMDKPLRRTRSSLDLSTEQAASVLRDDNEEMAREAILRSARKVANEAESKQKGSRHRGQSISASFDARSSLSVGQAQEADADVGETAVEWLMVTRSDPGGSVPRFMVEKGTPGGIVSDAGRLLDWLAAKDPSTFEASGDNDFQAEAVSAERDLKEASQTTLRPTGGQPSRNLLPDPEAQATQAPPAPSGFYGMIAGALGVVGSAVISRVPNPFSGSTRATDSDPDLAETGESDSDDRSSIASFASAMESTPPQAPASVDNLMPEIASTHSAKSDESKALSTTPTMHERELKKLQERRRKVQEKITKMEERSLARKGEDKEKDAAALQRFKDKHDREIAKQEEKYQRELAKLEQKRAAEERKAEDKRRRQQEREEKANLSVALEKAKAERDVARKQIDILKEQIGELQSQNTMLVAKLGKNGLLNEEDFRKGGLSGQKMSSSALL